MENDPILRRLKLGIDPELIQEVFGLTDSEIAEKVNQLNPKAPDEPKKRGRPKKIDHKD